MNIEYAKIKLTFCLSFDMVTPMEKSKISIITPVYNGEKYLVETIQSVINQSYANFELIIVDDGSTDNSKHIAEDFAKKDERIHVITQINSGSAAARNHGIRVAKGRYIVLLDADDLWMPEFLEKQLKQQILLIQEH